MFITGGSGFIGSHFLNQALSSGYQLLALRRSVNSTTRIPLVRQPTWLTASLINVTVDDLNGCDVLVHFAAHSVQYPHDTLLNCLQWNVMSVISLFEKARLAGIKHYVVAGSCFEYGKSGERFSAIPTDAPLVPTSSYAASKAAASIALQQWALENSVHLDILRVFHVFGKGEACTRFWPTLRHAALNGKDMSMTMGDQLRDFLPVEDVAATFLYVSTRKPDPHTLVRTYNLGSGSPCTLREFAEYWWGYWNAVGSLLIGQLPYRDHEVMRYIPGEKLLRLRHYLAEPSHITFEPL